jgi:hypothetical protein
MQGEALSGARITAAGIRGDRAFAVFDLARGAIPGSSDAELFAGLLQCRARYADEVEPAGPLPPVRVSLPDGSSALTSDPILPTLLSACFGRQLALVDIPPPAYSARQTAFLAGIGLSFPPSATLVDFAPISIITTSSLEALARARPEARFDTRRFRMNVVGRTATEGFIENRWIDRRVQVGEAVLAVRLPDPRCAVTNLPQDGLPKDPSVLKTIARVNSVAVGTGGPLPCAGVYAEVVSGGVIRVGDPIAVA